MTKTRIQEPKDMTRNRSLPNINSTKTFRFGIRKLLLFIASAAVLCGLFVIARNTYYYDRFRTESALSKLRGISNIKLHAYVDVTEEINSSSFTVDGHQGSVVTLGGLASYENKGRFWLTRVGPWSFRVTGRRHLGARNSATGEPVESNYLGSGIELGSASPYNALFPFKLDTPQDVADHYAELVAIFETWPPKASPGQVTLSDGTTQFYHVEKQRQ